MESGDARRLNQVQARKVREIIGPIGIDAVEDDVIRDAAVPNQTRIITAHVELSEQCKFSRREIKSSEIPERRRSGEEYLLGENELRARGSGDDDAGVSVGGYVALSKKDFTVQ